MSSLVRDAAAQRKQASMTQGKLLDLSALADPEGSIHVVNTKSAPYVTAFHDVGEFLRQVAQMTPRIGRRLMMTAPGHEEAENGAPVFRRGSGSSDVLHAILDGTPDTRYVLGHSKGALVIKNALDGLTSDMTKRLHIVTFGCAIDEAGPKIASYRQILGRVEFAQNRLTLRCELH